MLFSNDLFSTNANSQTACFKGVNIKHSNSILCLWKKVVQVAACYDKVKLGTGFRLASISYQKVSYILLFFYTTHSSLHWTSYYWESSAKPTLGYTNCTHTVRLPHSFSIWSILLVTHDLFFARYSRPFRRHPLLKPMISWWSIRTPFQFQAPYLIFT